MSKEKFSFKDYWALFKLSCRPYIYRAPFKKDIKPFIAGYIFFGTLWTAAANLLLLNWQSIISYLLYFALAYLAIINPYYLKYALHYKTSDWFLNTGYYPSDVCGDVGLFGEYHATMDYAHLKGKHGKIYNGLIIPKPDGSFTELDMVIVSEHTLSVVEAKARQGVFSGHILDDTWTQKLGSQTNELQNPVIQNQNHINFLTLYLDKMKKRRSSKADNFEPIFHNIVYFALAEDVRINGHSRHVDFDHLSKKQRVYRVTPRYSLEQIQPIIDILDALPKYTGSEKVSMYDRREVQYRNGDFIHSIVYYPVIYQIDYDSRSYETICMDAETYQLYLDNDGLWRAVPGAADGILYQRGASCSTLQEATLLKKEWNR